MKVLVTGASSFVGAHFALEAARDQLAGGGQDIEAADRHESLRSDPAVLEGVPLSPHESNAVELNLPPAHDKEEGTEVVQVTEGP